MRLRFRSYASHALVLLGVLLLLPPVGQSDSADSAPLPMMAILASPYTIQRLAYDPWETGVWIGTEGGLFFKDLQTGALRHYGIGQGLPHFMVHDVTLDASRVWIGTGWGVAVLDRASQQISLVERADGTVLRATSRTVFADTDGVWLGTDERGLYRIDRERLVATAIPNPVNGTTFAHRIYGLGAVGGELYVSAARYGLVRWDRPSGQSWLYNDSYLQEDPYYGRIDASPKEVWIGSAGEGALRLDRSTWKMDEFASYNSVNSHEVYRPVKAFGQVWFPTWSGVSMHDPVAKTWRVWSDFPGGGNLNEVVLADGELYGATDKAFIVRYDRGTQDWQYVPWWSDAQTMDYNLVQSCERTPEGLLLFGTGGGGVHAFDPGAGWSVYGGVPGIPQPADINILASASDERSRFFTHYKGVSQLDVARGEYRHFFADGRGSADTRWGSNIVRDVELDNTTAWFASRTTHEKQLRPTDPVVWHAGKVARMDRQTQAVSYYGTAAGLSDGNLTTLALDGTTLWIGTERNGLDALDTVTGRVRHVFPSSGTLKVTDILVDGRHLWLATTQQGLLRLDPQTGQVQAVPGAGPAAPLSLHQVGGSLWVGTYYGGLVEVDRSTLQVTQYHAPGPLDRVIYCLADLDGVLYAGTGWGVERFDLELKTFLRQTVTLAEAPNDAPSAAPIAADLHITAPSQGASFDAGTPSIYVAGSATAPAGSSIQVRIGNGAWMQADGLASWSATVDLRDLPSQVRVAVRLEHAGQLLAQAFHDIIIGGSAAPGALAPSFEHLPVLQAWVGEPWTLGLAGAIAPGTTATATVVLPDGKQVEVPLVAQGNGSLAASMPAFRTEGPASYRIDVVADGVSLRLPAPEDGYGASYPMVVKSVTEGAGPRFVDPGETHVQAGMPVDLVVIVQNPSSRDQTMRVRLTAPAGVTGPSELFVPGGGSARLTLRVAIDGHHAAARERIGLELLLLQGEGALAALGFDLVVTDAAGVLPPEPREPPEPRDAPLSVWLAVMALLVVAARRRR